MPDLTETVYVIIVLAYATLATTNYLFSTLESRAQKSVKNIDIWWKELRLVVKNSDESEEVSLGQKAPITKLREEYDVINLPDNSKIGRWQWLQISLFASVAIAAVLLFPVLVVEMGVLGKGNFAWWCTFILKVIIIFEQAFASALVPIVGFNLRQMNRRLARIQKFETSLHPWVAALHMIQPNNNHKPSLSPLAHT